MTDFLTSLLLRARGETPVVRPITGSLYGAPLTPPLELVEEAEALPLADSPPAAVDVRSSPGAPPAPEAATSPVPPPSPPRALDQTTAPERVPAHLPDPADKPAATVAEVIHDVQAAEAPSPQRRTLPLSQPPLMPPPRAPRPAVPPATSLRAEPATEQAAIGPRRIEEHPEATAIGSVDDPPIPPGHPVLQTRASKGLRPVTTPEQLLRSPPGSPSRQEEVVAEQPITISIGRVEVRAPTPVAPPAAAARLARPSMSLDDYLRQRDEGLRR